MKKARDALHGIEIPHCTMGLRRLGDVLVFEVAFDGASKRGARLSAVGVDGDGLRFGFSNKPAAEGADLVSSTLAAGEPNRDDLFAAATAFGLTGYDRTIGGMGVGDLALDLVSECEGRHPWLREVPRTETVPLAHMRMLSAGLSRIVDGIGPHRLAIQARSSPLDGIDQPLRLRMPAATAETVHAAMEAYPAIASDLALLHRHLDIGHGPRGAAEHALRLAGLNGPATRELLRQVSGGGGPAECTRGFLHVLAMFPRDWMPAHSARADWDALFLLVGALREASWATKQDIRDLAAPARGRWSRFASRLATASGTELSASPTISREGLSYRALENASRDVADMATDAFNTLILPLASWHAGAERDLSDAWSQDLVSRLLFKGRGLPKILEMSRKWHRAGGVPLRSRGGGRGTLTWDPALPERNSAAVRIVPLASTDALYDEGAKGIDRDGRAGLEHCVGSHWQTCMSGHARVMGVRRTSDGARLSTFEIGFTDAGPRLSEHKGLRNEEPPEEATAAVDAYVADLLSGRITFPAADLAEARRKPLLSVEDACGYDWRVESNLRTAIDAWAPYLARSLRDVGPEAFMAVALSSTEDAGQERSGPRPR